MTRSFLSTRKARTPPSCRTCDLTSTHLLENDYLVSNILSADFKYFAERNLLPVFISGVELNARSILNHKDVP